MQYGRIKNNQNMAKRRALLKIENNYISNITYYYLVKRSSALLSGIDEVEVIIKSGLHFFMGEYNHAFKVSSLPLHLTVVISFKMLLKEVDLTLVMKYEL